MPTDSRLIAVCFDCGWSGDPNKMAKEEVEKMDDGTIIYAAYCPECHSGRLRIKQIERLPTWTEFIEEIEVK